MTTLTQSGLSHQSFFADSGTSSLADMNSDTVTIGGISDALEMSRSIGSTFIATGTNQSINIAECGVDDSICDMGKGLTLSFYELGDASTIPDAWLKVYGFGLDPTGSVTTNTNLGEFGQTRPDGHGGTYLALSGVGYGMVDFVNCPQATLNAHIHAGPLG